MASELQVDELKGVTADGNITITSEGGSATMQLQQGLCKEWILMDGTGTIAIDDSLNVTSITDEGTGTYTITGTNAFSTTNFLVSECIVGNGAVTVSYNNYTKTTTTYRIGNRRIETDVTGLYDAKRANESFFGDLA